MGGEEGESGRWEGRGSCPPNGAWGIAGALGLSNHVASIVFLFSSLGSMFLHFSIFLQAISDVPFEKLSTYCFGQNKKISRSRLEHAC